jgi:hypothetical protein
MQKRTEFEKILKTAIVSAFTFAVALIWRDFFVSFLEIFVPTGNAIYYELIFAIIATIFIIFMIYVFIRTEREAEYLLRKMNASKGRKKK